MRTSLPLIYIRYRDFFCSIAVRTIIFVYVNTQIGCLYF